MNESIPPRPGRAEAIDAAIKEYAGELYVWHQTRDSFDDCELTKDEVLEMVRSCATCNDGYAFAKSLDNKHGWAPDAELVSILHKMMSQVDIAERKLVFDWVKQYNVQPKYKIGDVLSVQDMPAMIGHFTVELKIVGLIRGQARYITVDKYESSQESHRYEWLESRGTLIEDGK